MSADDEREREEAAEAAGVDPDELTEQAGDPPVATPAGRAYSIRAALASARKTRRSARRSLLIAIAALLVAVGLAGQALTGGSDADEEVIDPEDIVEQVSPSTVRITADGKGLRSEGSGWVLDAGAGLIVTNFHVVGGGSDFDVRHRRLLRRRGGHRER